LTLGSTQRYSQAMTAEILKLAALKQVLRKLRALRIEARDVRYVSAPVWKLWRDF
jgi:hypothetical protein